MVLTLVLRSQFRRSEHYQLSICYTNSSTLDIDNKKLFFASLANFAWRTTPGTAKVVGANPSRSVFLRIKLNWTVFTFQTKRSIVCPIVLCRLGCSITEIFC